MGLRAQQRQEHILRRLNQWGTVGCTDLAAELEVAVKTIQRDLDVLAERGVAVRVHGGAASPRSRRDRGEARLRIGVLFPTRNRYYAYVRAGVEEAARHADVDLIAGAYEYSGEFEVHQLRKLSELRLDGLLITLGYANDSYTQLAELDLPTVLVERPMHQLGGVGIRSAHAALNRLDHVYSDHSAGVVHVLDHLYSLGHRQVHCLIEQTPTSHGLLLGLSESQVGPQLPYWGTHTTQTLEVRQHQHDPSVVANLVAECAAGKHTAIVVHTDPLAVAVYEGLRDAGLRVPGDVSLVAYDDVDLTGPPLSAVSPRRHWVGLLACELLVDRLRSRGRRAHGQWPPHRISLSPQLMLRGTTAPPSQMSQTVHRL